MTRPPPRLLLAALPAALLAGCGGPAPAPPQDLDGLDRELADANGAANLRDPAVSDALAGQIMVDPALVQSANAHAVRPPDRPPSGGVMPEPAATDPLPPLPPVADTRADCPDCAARRGTLTIGALGQCQRDRATAACAAGIGYSAVWATRLPPALPLYPGASVVEAAGSDAGDCRLRIVAFVTGAPPAKALAFYAAAARRAGFTAEIQSDGASRLVGGTRGDAAFVAYADPRGTGSSVQLIVNGG